MDLNWILESLAETTPSYGCSSDSLYEWDDFDAAWRSFETSIRPLGIECSTLALQESETTDCSGFAVALTSTSIPRRLGLGPWDLVPGHDIYGELMSTSIKNQASETQLALSSQPPPAGRSNLSRDMISTYTNQVYSQKGHALVTSSTVLTCETCAKTFFKRDDLNRHIALHSKPIQCPEPTCTLRKARRRLRDMQRHILAKHPNLARELRIEQPPRAMCPVAWCKRAKKGFGRQDHLTRHMRRAHVRGPDS